MAAFPGIGPPVRRTGTGPRTSAPPAGTGTAFFATAAPPTVVSIATQNTASTAADVRAAQRRATAAEQPRAQDGLRDRRHDGERCDEREGSYGTSVPV
ncbi:hypothetical protein [Amycolatopsis sp. FDAARGOS 1241]|uniref:hypothetical protein n=1 Tax=Amycolatopsis sp. FDAARGOS 1241 TaxID=2778070 RepID=UPI00194FC20F|nr:hypothetical protein [Amycolatopsis sp. FDAARGOS 1241]QRP48502.1 hypothetical protein I6J71_12040 [Amycolatopsis sp. FDAARGOS 1241]